MKFDTREINSKILNIFNESFAPKLLKEQFGNPVILAPLLYPDLIKRSVLFVGMNPSFDTRYLAKAEGVSENELWKLYNIKNAKYSAKWIESVEKATHSEKTHPYFGKFEKVTEYLNKYFPEDRFDWEHIDLLTFRNTQQNESLKRLGLDRTDNPAKISDIEMRKFIIDQLNVAKELLENIEPRIIIVVNAKASRIYKSFFVTNWCEKYGCYFTDIKERKVQTHLTGMLTQQRALDKESFRSLKWNIKYTYENNENY